jgi:DNA-binding PadR family transcriptional regulator
MAGKGRRRRSIGVPRGLLRHLSFQFLRKSPMSGSEIVDRIEEYTGWRPSPGSIYPLLSHMQEAGLIQPYEDEDPALKRFELTDMGRARAEEMLAHDEQMKNRNSTIRRMYWRLHVGMTEELYVSLSHLLGTLEEVYSDNKGNPEVSAKLRTALDSAATNVREIGTN